MEWLVIGLIVIGAAFLFKSSPAAVPVMTQPRALNASQQTVFQAEVQKLVADGLLTHEELQQASKVIQAAQASGAPVGSIMDKLPSVLVGVASKVAGQIATLAPYVPFAGIAYGIGTKNAAATVPAVTALAGSITGSAIAAAPGAAGAAALGALAPFAASGIGIVFAAVPAIAMYLGAAKDAEIAKFVTTQGTRQLKAFQSDPTVQHANQIIDMAVFEGRDLNGIETDEIVHVLSAALATQARNNPDILPIDVSAFMVPLMARVATSDHYAVIIVRAFEGYQPGLTPTGTTQSDIARAWEAFKIWNAPIPPEARITKVGVSTGIILGVPALMPDLSKIVAPDLVIVRVWNPNGRADWSFVSVPRSWANEYPEVRNTTVGVHIEQIRQILPNYIYGQ